MLDADTFNKFIGKSNQAYQQFCIWFSVNNEFIKNQARWNELASDKGCKYKNFWPVVVATLQHSWVLSTARLFDLAYYSRDKKKERPRISLDYILIKLEDVVLAGKIREELKSHQKFIDSIWKYRSNVHAHNDANFTCTCIEAGIEKLFQWLEDTIAKIKDSKPYFNKCGIINIKHTEELSRCGVDELFETLLLGEKYEK